MMGKYRKVNFGLRIILSVRKEEARRYVRRPEGMTLELSHHRKISVYEV